MWQRSKLRDPKNTRLWRSAEKFGPINVGEINIQVAEETLKLARQRFDAGVANNAEVVQSQESITQADLDYINSVFAHNLAKLSLARAIGEAVEDLPRFLTM